MAIALITSLMEGAPTRFNFTTSAIDTTGADLIVISLSWDGGVYGSGVFTDSKSNSWTQLTERQGSFGSKHSLFYKLNPTVGSGHTFYVGNSDFSSAAIGVLAFSGAHASSSYANETGATSYSTSLATGSLTPPEDNCVVVAGLSVASGYDPLATSISINSGFTAYTKNGVSSGSRGAGIAYLIQTTAGAVNPTWSWTNSNPCAANIASFKAAATASPVGAALHHYRQQGMMRHQQPKIFLPNREIITELPRRRRLIENRLAL